MNIDIEEFEGYLQINKAELDEELIQQPTLFYKISHELELMLSQRDKAKQHMDVIYAQLDGDYRAELDEAEEKYTEPVIKNLVLTDKEHQAAVDDYTEWNEKARVLASLKDAFSQRSYMLRDLVSLTVANYYERESITVGSNQEQDMKYSKRKGDINKKRQARKRIRGK